MVEEFTKLNSISSEIRHMRWTDWVEHVLRREGKNICKAALGLDLTQVDHTLLTLIFLVTKLRPASDGGTPERRRSRGRPKTT